MDGREMVVPPPPPPRPDPSMIRIAIPNASVVQLGPSQQLPSNPPPYSSIPKEEEPHVTVAVLEQQSPDIQAPTPEDDPDLERRSEQVPRPQSQREFAHRNEIEASISSEDNDSSMSSDNRIRRLKDYEKESENEEDDSKKQTEINGVIADDGNAPAVL